MIRYNTHLRTAQRPLVGQTTHTAWRLSDTRSTACNADGPFFDCVRNCDVPIGLYIFHSYEGEMQEDKDQIEETPKESAGTVGEGRLGSVGLHPLSISDFCE